MLKIIGHRGVRGAAPENSLAALRLALSAGVDEIEIDVRVTQDGVAILHHDSDAQDDRGARMPIRHHSLDQLRLHKPDITTLEDAIQAIDRRVPLHIEVKPGEPAIPVIKVLQIFLTQGWLETDFLLASKSQPLLLQLHKALPAIPTVIIEPFSGLRAVLRARQIGTKRLSMNHRWLWRGFVKPMAKRGYHLYAYTVNDPARARKLARYGLAGVITDNPEAYR